MTTANLINEIHTIKRKIMNNRIDYGTVTMPRLEYDKVMSFYKKYWEHNWNDEYVILENPPYGGSYLVAPKNISEKEMVKNITKKLISALNEASQLSGERLRLSMEGRENKSLIERMENWSWWKFRKWQRQRRKERQG